MHKARARAAQPGASTILSIGLARALPLGAAILLALHLLIGIVAPLTAQAAPSHPAQVSDVVAWLPGPAELLSVTLLPALAQEPGDAEPNPTLEFIRQMTALDVLFLMLWVGAIVLGLATGVIRQLLLIIALIVGSLIAAALSGPISNWTGPFTGSTRDVALPGTYAALLILSVAAVYFFSTRLYPETRLGQYYLIDRLGGAVLGFATGLIAVAVLVGMLAVLTSREWPSMDSTRTNMHAQLTTTPFLPLIATTFPLVTQTIGATLPLPLKDICERCL